MQNVEIPKMSNNANMTVDEARALVSDQALWPLVRDFLWDFAPQIHRSWLEGAGMPEHIENPDRLEKLFASPRVKAHVLSVLGVSPCFHAFPKGDWSRLVLLDGAMLESIAKWLGALACADSLRRVTEGAVVRALKADLPGIYPEVFGFTAYFAKIGFLRRDTGPQGEESQDAGGRPSIAEDVVSYGLSAIGLLLADAPPFLVDRLRFKLPRNICASAAPRLEKETCGTAVAKLLKLRFPEAYKLCC